MRSSIVFVLVFLLHTACVQAKSVRIEIVSNPQLTPLLDTLFLCGSMNNWNYNDHTHAFKKEPNGRFVIDLKLQKFERVQFVVTRGQEANREVVSDSLQQALRTVEYGASDTLYIEISAWEDIPMCEGLSPNVRLFDADFRSEQFENPRRVWLYCPPNWESSLLDFDVLVMLDGQNLFSSTTSFAGEWHLDENMDELIKSGCSSMFVVGVENGGSERLMEYTPFRHSEHGGGNGDKHLSFLENELLPALRKSLPVAEGSEHTMIGGSSLGALLSAFAVMQEGSSFGGAMVFSPAFWINRKEMLEVASSAKYTGQRIYFSMGNYESASLVNEVVELRDALLMNDWPAESLPMTVDPDGQHNERSWDAQSYKCLLFLSRCTDYEMVEEMGNPILLYPNPAEDHVLVALSDKQNIQRVFLVDAQSKEVAVALGGGERRVSLALGNLTPNAYTLMVESVSGEIFSTVLMVK